MENERVKIWWDFNIQTDHVIQHGRPDIVIVYKKERKCQLIDIAIPDTILVSCLAHCNVTENEFVK